MVAFSPSRSVKSTHENSSSLSSYNSFVCLPHKFGIARRQCEFNDKMRNAKRRIMRIALLVLHLDVRGRSKFLKIDKNLII